MGLCGERANDEIVKNGEGISSLKRYMIDGVELIDIDTMERGVKIEEF